MSQPLSICTFTAAATLGSRGIASAHLCAESPRQDQQRRLKRRLEVAGLGFGDFGALLQGHDGLVHSATDVQAPPGAEIVDQSMELHDAILDHL